ncbi:Ras protein rab [Oopsacas minuta]|uniref:Ras protein rab n=1 Tax=Oopsacas minuta TaxID=111878 RepID=A0AAV7JQL9_9METZ|nr:Ras protein rab [Oopsacas minuta]
MADSSGYTTTKIPINFILDVFKESGSVNDKVKQVKESRNNASWVLIGTTGSTCEDDPCQVLTMEVIKFGDVIGDLMKLLPQDKILYCYIKLECINEQGTYRSLLIHWIGENVSRDYVNACEFHIDEIKEVIGISDDVVVSRNHQELMSKFKKLSRLEIPNREKLQKSSMAPYEVNFKLCIIGDSDVGKSSILKSFKCEGRGLKEHELPSATVGYNFHNYKFNVPNTNTTCKVNICDTGGQEKFRSMTIQHFRNSHVVLMVYDIADAKSFEAIPYWFDFVKEYVADKAIFMLVGNKSDLFEKREVKQIIAQNYAKENGCEYFECSTTQGSNIFHLFNQIEKNLPIVYPEMLIPQQDDTSNIDPGQEDRSRKKCCKV